MATVQVKVEDGVVSDATTVNDGGVIVKGGDLASDSKFTVNKSLVDMADGGTEYGSKVLAQDGTSSENEDYAGVKTALNTGTLAFFPNSQEGERNFLIRGVGTTDGNGKINNSASDALLSGASEVGIRTVNKVHKMVDTRLVGTYATAEFDILTKPSTAMVPGRTKGTGAGNDSNFVQVADGSTAATDDAASPNRSVPGELTFMFGGARPTNTADGNSQDYKARDSYEA